VYNESEKYQNEFYEKFYSKLMGTGLIAVFWRIIHNQMEKSFRNGYYPQILEVGAGNGEHLGSVNCAYDNYFLTDLRVENLQKATILNNNVLLRAEDVCNLSFPDSTFDRVIMTCVLSHLNDPLLALSEMRRVVKDGGYVSIYLPCEPGIMLRVIRKLSTRAKARKIGVENIEFLHFIEHKNYFIALNYFIRWTFVGDQVKRRNYPFRLLSWNGNLYSLYNIKIKKN
jgi:ubiquinone/menaquinone biosynthesis C-methylase UbiE